LAFAYVLICDARHNDTRLRASAIEAQAFLSNSFSNILHRNISL